MEQTDNQFLRGKTHIIGDYYLDADAYQHILVERGIGTTKQDGREVEVERDYILGYYSSVRQALEGLLKIMSRKKVSSGECATIKDLISYLANISSQITSIPC